MWLSAPTAVPESNLHIVHWFSERLYRGGHACSGRPVTVARTGQLKRPLPSGPLRSREPAGVGSPVQAHRAPDPVLFRV